MNKRKLLALSLAAIIGCSFTRAATAEQLDLARVNRDLPAQTRDMQIDSVDKEKRTVQISFSSEHPVRRWYGNEILDHSPGAVDFTRLESGAAALLVDHNWQDQVGVIERAWLGDDRRCYAIVRFGKSARADEIFNDVIDKIRTLVSVGYQVLEAKLSVEREDGEDDYLMTRWLPYEISFVSVPADHTVGAGRAAPFNAIPHNDSGSNPVNNGRQGEKPTAAKPEPGARKMEKNVYDTDGNYVRAIVDENDKILRVLKVIRMNTNNDDGHGGGNRTNPPGGAEGGERTAAQVLEDERTRVRELTTMGTSYNLPTEAARAVADGITVEAFRAIALDAINTRQQQQPGTRQPRTRGAAPAGTGERGTPLAEMDSPEIGLSDEEVRNYSIFNVVRHLSNPTDMRLREAASFELECSETAQRQTGRNAQGVLIPQDVLQRFGNEATMRAFNAGGAADTPTGAVTGKNLVATNYMASSFIDLLRQRTVIMQLARTMGGLVGNVEIPKQIAGSQAYWIGEHEDAQETTPVIGQIGLNPHTLAAYTDISRRLLMQSTPDAEGIVRADLIAAIGSGINAAAFYGTGENNQPLGLLNQDGINAVGFANASPTFAELVEMESAIAADDADVNSMAYVINTAQRGYFKTTPKLAGGSDQGLIWEPGNGLNGYRAEVTNTIKAGDVFFGNFNDLIIGMWGGLDLIVDPYSLSKKGALRLVVFQDVDFALRRVESFTYGHKAAVTA